VKKYARVVTLRVRFQTCFFVCSYYIYVAGIAVCIDVVCSSLLYAGSPGCVVYYVLLHVS
jgi:hypothetical protein